MHLFILVDKICLVWTHQINRISASRLNLMLANIKTCEWAQVSYNVTPVKSAFSNIHLAIRPHFEIVPMLNLKKKEIGGTLSIH